MKEKVLCRPDERCDAVNDNLFLIQRKEGLTFGTDALLLAAFIRAQKGAIAAELGSGTGIISMLLATREKFDHITAAEIQPLYAELTARNVALNHLEERVRAVEADVRAPLSIGTLGSFDAVFTNPPYMKTTSGYANTASEKNAARHEVNGDIGDFCAAAAKLLKYGGRFYTVYRTDRITDLLYAMRKERLEPKRMTFVHAHVGAPPSMVLTEARLGAGVGLRISRPLFLHRDRQMLIATHDMETVYETGLLFPEEDI
ncbi:MAG: methyltransferase [Clostridia bacterium]|nr:methyltransferase [Clostridia bacterium]